MNMTALELMKQVLIELDILKKMWDAAIAKLNK